MLIKVEDILLQIHSFPFFGKASTDVDAFLFFDFFRNKHNFF